MGLSGLRPQKLVQSNIVLSEVVLLIQRCLLTRSSPFVGCVEAVLFLCGSLFGWRKRSN